MKIEYAHNRKDVYPSPKLYLPIFSNAFNILTGKHLKIKEDSVFYEIKIGSDIFLDKFPNMSYTCGK